MNTDFSGLRQIRISILLICFFVWSHCIAKNVVNKQAEWLQPDKACGPRCIWALMQITKKGDPSCSIEHIYELIGKKPFGVITLKDLKVVAEKLGFFAVGYKLTLNRLENINAYAILPVGKQKGTDADPLHFVLLKEARAGFATIVDTQTLELENIAFSDLQKIWKGYTLLLTPSAEIPLFRKSSPELEPQPASSLKPFDDVKNFGIVDSGSMLEHTFTIRNETGQPCKLRITSKSCSCISPELGKTDLKPKEETWFKLKLHVDRPAWSIEGVGVALEPTNIIKRYIVKAYGKDSFQTTPAIGHIESPDGGVVEYQVKITYYTDSNDIVALDRIDSNIPNLSIGSIVTEKVKKDQYTTFYFNVTLLYDGGDPTNAVRKVQDELNFVLDTRKGKRFIPFRLLVKTGKPICRLTPEKVFLIVSKSKKPTQKKVKAEFLTSAPPMNIAIRSDDVLPLEIKTTQVSKDIYIINISVETGSLQKAKLGMNKGEVIIVPEGVPNPTSIRLPVSLFIRE